MNYNSMTDLELLNYLDIYSDDPLIRRIISVISRTRGALIDDLEHAGMDPDTWMFRTDWQSMYPGEYIEQLRRDISHAEDELSIAQRELEEVSDKYHEIKTRTIMDFVQEVWQEKRTASHKVQAALQEAEKQREENNRLREQIDMWGKLNQVKQGV